MTQEGYETIEAFTARLREALPAAVRGPSWTTDAPYRETAEIAKYRAEGILPVEMEASCLFTVAKNTGTAAAAAFEVSDAVHGEQWEPHFGSRGVTQGLLDPLRNRRGMPVRMGN